MAITINIPEELSEEVIRRLQMGDVMRGVGYDIANSARIPEDEKMPLIRACESFFFADGSFTMRQRSLLYRIRKDYHIRQSGLYLEAKPASFWDEISNY